MNCCLYLTLSWRECCREAETSYLSASYVTSGDEKRVGALKEFEALKSGSFTHWPGTSVWELLSKYSDCQQDVYYMQN